MGADWYSGCTVRALWGGGYQLLYFQQHWGCRTLLNAGADPKLTMNLRWEISFHPASRKDNVERVLCFLHADQYLPARVISTECLSGPDQDANPFVACAVALCGIPLTATRSATPMIYNARRGTPPMTKHTKHLFGFGESATARFIKHPYPIWSSCYQIRPSCWSKGVADLVAVKGIRTPFPTLPLRNWSFMWSYSDLLLIVYLCSFTRRRHARRR